MKKVLSVLLCVTLLFSLTATAFAADSQLKVPILQFHENGEFKILHLCDCQDVYPASGEMIEYICETLDTYKPDLVVLGGDNTVGPKETKAEAIEELVKPFVDRQIFFTLVFGNHDYQQDVDKETLLGYYQLYGKGYCLAYDAVPSMSGCATHQLPIMSKDSIFTPAYRLWMFDSNEYETDAAGNEGYSCVQPDEIEWYKNISTSTTEALGKPLTSMAFQHIIVGDIMDVLFPTTPLRIDGITEFCNGKNYLLIPNLTKIKGQLFEIPCPGVANYGELDAFAECGDVVACFSGHDHVNEFSVNIKGVDIVNTPGATYNSYAKTFSRGARLITIHEGSRAYESENILVSDMALRDGSTIIGSGNQLSRFDCVMGIVLRKVITSFLNMIQIFG